MLESTSGGQTLVRKPGMLFNTKEAAQCVGTTLRSSVVGFFVGILPGAGATIASAITYDGEKSVVLAITSARGYSRRRRRKPETPPPAVRLFQC